MSKLVNTIVQLALSLIVVLFGVILANIVIALFGMTGGLILATIAVFTLGFMIWQDSKE